MALPDIRATWERLQGMLREFERKRGDKGQQAAR
jgi:hypothetical protein